jgi:hypothetical protein
MSACSSRGVHPKQFQLSTRSFAMGAEIPCSRKIVATATAVGKQSSSTASGECSE